MLGIRNRKGNRSRRAPATSRKRRHIDWGNVWVNVLFVGGFLALSGLGFYSTMKKGGVYESEDAYWNEVIEDQRSESYRGR